MPRYEIQEDKESKHIKKKTEKTAMGVAEATKG
jgi:hypothetical protein